MKADPNACMALVIQRCIISIELPRFCFRGARYVHIVHKPGKTRRRTTTSLLGRTTTTGKSRTPKHRTMPQPALCSSIIPCCELRRSRLCRPAGSDATTPFTALPLEPYPRSFIPSFLQLVVVLPERRQQRSSASRLNRPVRNELRKPQVPPPQTLRRKYPL